MRTTALILLLTSSGWAGAQWSEIGSGLPRTIAGVTSLAIDSATPSTLYSVDINGRLFKSTDGGGSWRVRGSVSAVVLSRSIPRTHPRSMLLPNVASSRAPMGEKTGPPRTVG